MTNVRDSIRQNWESLITDLRFCVKEKKSVHCRKCKIKRNLSSEMNINMHDILLKEFLKIFFIYSYFINQSPTLLK